MSSQTLLIPIEFPDPDPLPSTFVGGFTSCRIVLLGVYEMPPDADPDEEQRREIEAYHTLYSLANQFVRSGDTAEVELVTGQNLSAVSSNAAEDRDVDAVLIPNPITTMGRVLVPIRDERFAEPVSEFVGNLDQDYIIHTTLLHVADSEDDVDEGQKLLSDVRDRLDDSGFPRTSIDTDVVVSNDAAFAISQAAQDYDIIVMGETGEPTVERVFGKTYESVAEQTQHPVVVVRDA